MFSAFNPSKCKHTRSSGQPTLRRPGSSWGSGALFKGLTSVVDNSCWSRDLNPRPRVTSPTLYPLESRLPLLVLVVVKLCLIFVRAFNISHFHENGLGCVLPRQRGYTIQFARQPPKFNGILETSWRLLLLSVKPNQWMHLSPFYTRMHGEWLRYAKSTSQFHWRYLLSQR